MPIDMSKYLGLFVSEATEHLEALGQDLVKLEKESDPGVVDSMFRHAHSVKGMASSMGFESIAILAHRMEDLVDQVRGDRSLLDQPLVDLLLSSSDHLLEQVRRAGGSEPLDDGESLIAALTQRLAAITGREPPQTRVAHAVVAPAAARPGESRSGGSQPGGSQPGGSQPGESQSGESQPGESQSGESQPAESRSGESRSAGSQPAESRSAGSQPAESRSAGSQPVHPEPEPLRLSTLGLPPRFAVKFKVAANSPTPGVRAFLVHRRLAGLGNLFDLHPALEELKAGRIPDGLVSLELETQHGEAGIRQALSNVPEVELVAVKEIVRGAAGAPVNQKPAAHEPQRTVRIRTELLDYFLDTVGELLLATARIREVSKVIPENARPPLEESVDRLHGLVKDLHDKVMGARMTPLALIMDRLPRVARDVARRREREVDLVITGAEIELDRAIIDELADPMLHILRNCIDHGIESPDEREALKKPRKGRVMVSVRRQRDRVVLEVEDDGRGMDAAKLKAAALERGLITQQSADRMSAREAFLLACMPGVSTAKDVSDISGRGVGMDAVKRTVENLGGTLEIDSEAGRGTRFTLRLPLTVAVVNLLLVQVGEEIFGLPIAKVLGATEAEESALSKSRTSPMLAWGTGLLPVHEMAELLGVPAPRRIGRRPYVVMEADAGKVALAVDGLLGQEEVVLKALSRPLDMVVGLSGVTILGSGRPVFILDVPRLIAA